MWTSFFYTTSDAQLSIKLCDCPGAYQYSMLKHAYAAIFKKGIDISNGGTVHHVEHKF